jgi:hypothetical protein
MVWSHWHFEKCTIVGCGILKWLQSVIKKWAEDKQTKRVLQWANNQAHVAKLAQEWRFAYETFEGVFAKSKVNVCLCSWSIKEDYIWR